MNSVDDEDAPFNFFEDDTPTPPPARQRRRQPTPQPLPPTQQAERLDELQELADTPFLQGDIVSIEDVQTRVHRMRIGEEMDHPLEGFRELITQLETIIADANDAMLTQPDAEWLRASISAMREISMNVQQVLPHWNEYQAQQTQIQEGWVVHFMNFVADYIIDIFGEDAHEDFFFAWEEFARGEDINTPEE